MNEYFYPINECGRIFRHNRKSFCIDYYETGRYYILKPGDLIFVLVTFSCPMKKGYFSDFYQYVVNLDRYKQYCLYPTISKPIGLPIFHGSEMSGLYACKYNDIDFPIKGGEITADDLSEG